MSNDQNKESIWVALAGITAVFAGTCCHWVETIKTWMQMNGEVGGIVKWEYGNFIQTGKSIVEHEGFFGLWKGV